MSEMVERVAKAIQKYMDEHHEYYADQLARAAIEAMREPTTGMSEAGININIEDDPDSSWRAMIDAALKD